MKKTTLVIMAAGIGSRFGKGTKQLTPVGPSGELIIDYSIYDALKAGFDKVVFIIRREIAEEFKETIGDRISKIVEVEYAFQEADDLPAGFKKPDGRRKPWGTGHAVLCCKGIVDGPFAVINADDYYGKGAYKLIYDSLNQSDDSSFGKESICMVGFRLGNTLSENGGVTRGVCVVNKENRLERICETRNIEKCDKGAIVRSESGDVYLSADTPVSMNMWGFGPRFIELLSGGFVEFLSSLSQDEMTTAEFLLPSFIDGLIKEGRAEVKVVETNDRWFGVTFQEDKESVRGAFRKLVDAGEYSASLYEAMIRER